MIKNYKNFEEYVYQKEIFPDKKDYRKYITQYLNEIKIPEKIKSNEFNTVKDVLDKYDNEKFINILFKKYIANENNNNNNIIMMDFIYIFDYTVKNNPFIITNFIKDEVSDDDDDIDIYFDEDFIEKTNIKNIDLNDNDDVTKFEKNVTDYINNNSVYNIFYEEGYYTDLIIYIIENYLDYINIHSELDNYDNYYNKLSSYLYNHMNNDYIPIYRMVDIPTNLNRLKKIKNEYDNIGEFWSYDKNEVNIYNYSITGSKQTVIFEGYVNINNVDWERTFYFSIYESSEEHEIRLYNNYSINITAFHSDKIEQKYLKTNKNKELTEDYYYKLKEPITVKI